MFLLNVLALALAALALSHIAAFGRNALDGLPLAINAGLLVTALALLARQRLLAVARHRAVEARRPGIDPTVEYPEPGESRTP